jgi:lysophospholipase L1-like esterase
MKNFAKIAAPLLVAALFATPAIAQRGSADFTRFVAIGDSYGAGYANGSVNERHQQYSWPAIIAKQAGLRLCGIGDTATSNCFAQPLVSYPGIGPELVLTSLAPTIVTAPGSGTPYLTTFGRPYNNLSIPGATVNDVLTVTGREVNPTRGVERLAQFILRGLGTEVDQALAQQPTFIGVWIGGNDFLGAATSGTPALLTPAAAFKTQYETLLDRLIAGAPNAGMVVGSLPQTANVPYLTTLPTVLVNPATRQPILIGGAPVPLIADLGGGTIGQLPAGSFVLLHAQTKLGLGYGIPPTLAQVPPFSSLPNVGQPLADTDVLTPAELAVIIARVTEYNNIINTAASARQIPVADIKGLFDSLASGHHFVGPFNITPSYVTGGFFSLDGVHPTDLGYFLFANQFIRAINNAYDTEIPLASIAQLYANNGAFFPDDGASLRFPPGTTYELSPESTQSLRSFWHPQTSRPRLRATNR